MAFQGIQCIDGELKGSEIPMEKGQKIIIGRDAKEANLVFRDGTISRKHLLVELDEDGEYYVTDYSSLGTAINGGDLLEHEVRTMVSSRTILEIGKVGTKVRLV